MSARCPGPPTGNGLGGRTTWRGDGRTYGAGVGLPADRVPAGMTTPGEERPIRLEGVPSAEDVDPADARERLDEDPDDIDRNREQAPTIVTDDRD